MFLTPTNPNQHFWVFFYKRCKPLEKPWLPHLNLSLKRKKLGDEDSLLFEFSM
jgi:hypothetical protein